MSSKHVDALRRAVRAVVPSFGGSITGRLTLLYTVASLGILLFATGMLYRALVGDLADDEFHYLEEKRRVLAAILRSVPLSSELLQQEVQRESGGPNFSEHYARVVDAGGRTLIETSGMSRVLPVSEFDRAAQKKRLPQQATARVEVQGRPFLLFSGKARGARNTADVWTIQLALDISDEADFVGTYRRTVGLVLLLGTLLAASAGTIVARRGLRPLRQIAETAERITASRLHERIEPTQWPEELVALAGAFNGMLRGLESSFARLSQFSADLAHELRTPLNNLMGETEVALSKSRSAPEYRQVLESAMEEYERLAHTIESILFLARAESPEMRIEREELDLRKEVDAVLQFHNAAAQEAGVTLLASGEAAGKANSNLLRRALSNLVSNAVQHTPAGGTVHVTLRQTADLAVEIAVEDTGCGIPTEYLPRIFDRFFRADPARSGQPQGTGLGLAIVKSIMQLHGGDASLRSEPGHGTAVTMVLPAA